LTVAAGALGSECSAPPAYPAGALLGNTPATASASSPVAPQRQDSVGEITGPLEPRTLVFWSIGHRRWSGSRRSGTHVDCRGPRAGLAVGLGEAAVTGDPQRKGAHGSRDGACAARSGPVLTDAGCRSRRAACLRQGCVLRRRRHADRAIVRPPLTRRVHTARAVQAWQAAVGKLRCLPAMPVGR
jgi:hypothetical protein